MEVKEKPIEVVFEKETEEQPTKRMRRRGVRRLAVGILAVLLLGIGIFGIYGTVRFERRRADLAKTIAAQSETIAALQKELEQQKAENDALQNEVKRKNEQMDALRENREPKVALTFDDGPGIHTERLLDALKTYHAKATFFLIGKNAARYPQLMKRMEAEGHAVGNHTYGHRNLTRLSAGGIGDELDKCNAVFEQTLGHPAALLRTPGGSHNGTVRGVAEQKGMPVIGWSVDTRDWESRDAEKILEVAFGKNGIKDGSIVLMHDIYETSVEAAEAIIKRLHDEGYTFLTVPELLAERKDEVAAGKVYDSAYPPAKG